MTADITDSMMSIKCQDKEGNPWNKTPKDKCEAAGCVFSASTGSIQGCLCTTQETCAKTGGKYSVTTCKSHLASYGPWLAGFSSCGCKAQGQQDTVKETLDSNAFFSDMCCGGGPLICDDYIDPQKKTCEQKYFCKSNQYATGVTGVTGVRGIPSGQNVKVAGNCVNCPPGATCDGTSAVKCDDPNASFKAGKCGKP